MTAPQQPIMLPSCTEKATLLGKAAPAMEVPLGDHEYGYEDTPAYAAMKRAGILCTEYRRADTNEIFTGNDMRANTDAWQNIKKKCQWGYFCGVCCLYKAFHTEMFVPAGHVGLLMNDRNEYLFAQPGMHNIASLFIRCVSDPTPLRGHILHGNRTIVIVEQGYIGYATDNGQPILLPPGIHVWTSESLDFHKSVALRDHIIQLGPYTLLTVDEGYAAVTQNNGKQMILTGGYTYLLDHMNWKFEKFMTLKIQTDDLEKIQATSADNINMMVTSTVNWRITNPVIAATMAAETMATSGKSKDVSADITKLRHDVLKQALASLAGFIGAVNYSESFHMSAANQSDTRAGHKTQESQRHSTHDEPFAEPVCKGFSDNPLYDTEKMMTAVEHSNRVTRTYGIEVMSINIISAAPVDDALTKSLACGAVASAEALQAETAARGTANAVRISAEANAEKERLESQGRADSEIILAHASAEATRIKAASDKEAEALCGEGAAERTRLHAAATSEGLAIVGRTVEKPGGQEAMVQRLAEQYIMELPEMAKHSKMMIVPDRPTDVSGVIATALSMTQAIGSQV